MSGDIPDTLNIILSRLVVSFNKAKEADQEISKWATGLI